MSKLSYCLINKLLLSKKLQEQGFTLLELIIVMMILAILMMLALPNFMSQIGKARETEAKIGLSTIAMAQQAYFFEKQSFANQMSQLSVTLNTHYYNFPDPTLVNYGIAKHQAQPINAASYNIRHYELGLYYIAPGFYRLSLCQSETSNDLAIVDNDPSAGCQQGTKLE